MRSRSLLHVVHSFATDRHQESNSLRVSRSHVCCGARSSKWYSRRRVRWTDSDGLARCSEWRLVPADRSYLQQGRKQGVGVCKWSRRINASIQLTTVRSSVR